MRNKGFSLVETLVVIAIIGIMSSVITPKVSIYLAKSKDTKAISNLSVLRAASQMYYLDEGSPLGKKETDLTLSDLDKLNKYFTGKINVGKESKEESKEGSKEVVIQEIGGSRDEKDGDIKLGGEITYGFSPDGINILMKKTTDVGRFSINNYEWEKL